MKKAIVLAGALVAALAVNASAQVKVKPGAGPGRGTGAGGPAKLGPATLSSPRTVSKPATTSGGQSSGVQGPAKGPGSK